MDPNFNSFIENIKLTELQKEDARTKVRSVCEKLHEVYYPNTTYNGNTKILIGSYGKHTHIRPPKDIDILFKMPDSEFERFNSLSGNKQSQLLQEIREVLKEKFVTTEEIRAFGKVIVISFSEGTHTVELLPAWQTESNTFKIPNSENGGSWDIWNPISEIQNISDSQDQTGRTKSLIRILKCWIRNCTVPIKSFLLELLVVNYFKERFNNQTDIPYSELVLGFFDFLKNQRNASLFSSATNTFINLGEEWLSKTESAYSRAKKAIEFEKDNDMRDASLEWKKIFGDDFLVADDKLITDTLTIKIEKLMKLYPSQKEEYITNKYGIEIKIDRAYNVKIDAAVTQDGFRGGWLTDFIKRRFPLSKGKKLLFHVQETNVPSPYLIMWKVRNFGDEAKRADGLRGEITEDLGYSQKEEHTKYEGEHYVECYIIKDKTCVAVGRVLVPIGQNYE